MTEQTKRFLIEIAQLEIELLSGMLGPIQTSHAILKHDNRVRALIDIYGKEQYEQFRTELRNV